MGETATKREFSGLCARWLSIDDAAELLGVSGAWLRQWVAGKCGPAMPARKAAGKSQVQPGPAYEHIVAHAKRRPPELRKPPGYDAAGESADDCNSAGSGPAFGPAILEAMKLDVSNVDLHTLVVQLAAKDADPSIIRAVSTAANAIQKRRADTVRAGKSLAPEDVVKMLRSHGELIAEEAEASAARVASALLRVLREKFNVDLGAKRTDAQQQLENFFLEEMNLTISILRKRVNDQVHDIQTLELSAGLGGAV